MRACNKSSDLVMEGFLGEVTLEQDLRPGGHLLEPRGASLPVGWVSEQGADCGPGNPKTL